MSRVALVLAYDGTDFAGWQFQQGLRTVQGTLQEALLRICGERVSVGASGRTDAGVHAAAQVAHCRPPERWRSDRRGLRQRLNALLPPDLRVLGAAAVGPDFDARRSALGKRYRYRLWLAPVASPFHSRYRLHLRRPLDLESMRAAAARFVGERDFASLQTTGSSVTTTRREIRRCELRGAAPEVEIVVEGNGFLRHMVRALAGCLLEVGTGRRAPDWIDELLAGKDRALAGANALACGLLLDAVHYPEPLASLLADAVLEPARGGAASDRDAEERAEPTERLRETT